jgi:N-carbamoylputrescine amidase
VEVSFYGRSFISDQYGQLVVEASRDKPEVISATFDLDAIDATRRSWGLFRDRRPEIYNEIVA